MAVAGGRLWSREELISAFRLNCLLPFGKLHTGTAEIIDLASLLGRPPSCVAMKLVNLASLDPANRASGNAPEGDREIWQAMAEESTRVLQLIGWNGAESRLVDEPREGYEGGTREAAVLVRLRQFLFRRSVFASTEADAA